MKERFRIKFKPNPAGWVIQYYDLDFLEGIIGWEDVNNVTFHKKEDAENYADSLRKGVVISIERKGKK
jgi:hypothetical protein